MNRQFLTLIEIAILMILGCAKKQTRQVQFNEDEILKVAVYTSGEIRVDDKVVSLQDLDGLLAANAGKNGVVWYYREAGMEEPSQQAMDAIALIVKHKRPVSMSSKPDFSDTIDANGNSVPRRK